MRSATDNFTIRVAYALYLDSSAATARRKISTKTELRMTRLPETYVTNLMVAETNHIFSTALYSDVNNVVFQQ